MHWRLGIAALLFWSLVSAIGCATPGARFSEALEADGIHVRHLRFKVKAEQAPALEAMMKRLVEVARSANLAASYDWLCYREQPDRYWLLVFADSAFGFVMPPTLAGFVSHVSSAGGDAARTQTEAMLATLEYEPDWEIVIRQKSKWSTVADMSPATHPKARMLERTVRPGSEAAFDDALAAWTTFLVGHDYPLPIEGFAPSLATGMRSCRLCSPPTGRRTLTTRPSRRSHRLWIRARRISSTPLMQS